jgi:hypothetical protein
MENMNIVYDFSILGPIFIPRDLAQQTADLYEAASHADLIGYYDLMPDGVLDKYYMDIESSGRTEIKGYEFRPNIFTGEAYHKSHEDFHGRNSIARPKYPDIAMSSWMPQDIQKNFGRVTHYYSVEENTMIGDLLILDNKKEGEIIQALEKYGYQCQNDGYLIWLFVGEKVLADFAFVLDQECEREKEREIDTYEVYLEELEDDEEDN